MSSKSPAPAQPPDPAKKGAPTSPGGPAAPTAAPGATKRTTIDELRLMVGGEGPAKVEGPNAFMHAFFQLFKTAQIHGIDNQALVRPIRNFIDVSSGLLSREGRISYQSKDRALFLNGMKLKLSTEEYELAYDTFEFFDERGMGGFTLDGSLDVAGVRTLLQILVYAPPARRKLAALVAELREAGLPFRLNKTLGAGKSSAEVVLERRSYTFFTYSKLVVLYRGLIAEERPNPMKRQFLTRKIGRAVQALVDICLEDDHTFLGVASVKSGESYAPHHAANTAVLAISLGEKLGLRKVELADLGLAAVFHDVGMRFIPQAVLDKRGPLEPAERAQLEQSPMRAVEFLLGEKALTRSVLAQMIVAFEHHVHADGTGYRKIPQDPDLFSRIVSIACPYDALTTDRPWRKAFLPDEALGHMLSRSGKPFDPVLLKVFVNTMGFYPVGTLVRLTTGELGLVVYGGGEAERATRPIVALLGTDGKPGKTLDLLERDASGRPAASIVSSEDPAKYGLRPSGLLATSPGV